MTLTTALWILLVGVAAMLLVAWLRRRRQPPSIPLLQAYIATADGQHYSVEYTALHPDTAPIEFARLALSFASKIVYIVSPNDPHHPGGHIAILRHLRAMAQAVFSGEDIFAAAKLSGNAYEQPAPPAAKVIRAKLSYIDVTNRHLHTSLPLTWFPQHFTLAAASLISTALPHLTPPLRVLLGASLEHLVSLYEDASLDPRGLASLIGAPSTAFHSALSDPRVVASSVASERT